MPTPYYLLVSNQIAGILIQNGYTTGNCIYLLTQEKILSISILAVLKADRV
jgi:hypothetical protein